MAVLFSVSGCATTQAIDIAQVTNVIDVRTVEEYNAGHLEGALNIPVETSDFTGTASQLNPDGKYIVYCKSGRRAGLALDTMTQLGFTDVTNLGSLENAATVTGLRVVQ